jgi:multidrug efflux pump subunit AcrA (membrane-fusion protein)
MENQENTSINTLERTEQVQHIIERMPTNFGFLVTTIVIFIFSLLLIFGWLIRYPDVIRGQVIINSNTSPIKLVAGTSGKLKLGAVKTTEEIKEGQIIAYIENPTSPKNVYFIDSLLKKYNPVSSNIFEIKEKLPATFSLGELNGKYYAFINSLQDFINYKEGKLLDKQKASLLVTLKEQKQAITIAKRRLSMGLNALKYAHKFYSRDSLLFIRKVISEAELDKSEVTYNNSKDSYQSYLNSLISARQQIQLTQSKIQDIEVQNPEKEKEVKAQFVSAYNDLADNIKIWEQKYVLKAPFSGRVQFLKFWTNNQFIQAGEQVFTVVPRNSNVIGQVNLPSSGAGKIKVGQEVIVKLDDYPFNEYGSVRGFVKSISLTTNTVRTEKGDIDNYLIMVDFPDQLKTNYGSRLSFKFESKGIAEIITNDRRFIERLFDNLKYITK